MIPKYKTAVFLLSICCLLSPTLLLGDDDKTPSATAADNRGEVAALLPDSCDEQSPGDADGDGIIDFRDMSYIAEYICGGGPAPMPLANGDPNGDCITDTNDVLYLFDYLVYGGPSPVECTCVEPAMGACNFTGPCDCIPGDANNDWTINVGDVIYNLKPVLKGGPLPVPYFPCSGDANSNCLNNIVDSYFITRYIFKNGQPPPNCFAWRIICGPYE